MNRIPVQRQAVPAYFHPHQDALEWRNLAAEGVALVVANVADGPGFVRERSWALALREVRAAGAHVVGYVDTGYLGLTGLHTRLGSMFLDNWIEQILHDVNTWYRLYGEVMTGIFFDQVTESEDGASIAHVYRRLCDRVRQLDLDAVIALNAGAPLPASFAGVADILVTFEGPCEAYLGESDGERVGEACFEPLNWRPGRHQTIWHIVHHTPNAAQAERVVELSRSRGAGLIYVTDGGGDNPYASLPSPDIWAASASTDASPIPDPRNMFDLPSGAAADPRDATIDIDPNSMLISDPMLVRDRNTIEASADFVVPSSCRRVFLSSRRRNVPRWWTGSSPQIAADWLIEHNRLYAYAGTGTDWTWRPTGQVIFEALGSRARWRLEAHVIGLDQDTDADAAFHVSAPDHREYSEVAIGCRIASASARLAVVIIEKEPRP